MTNHLPPITLKLLLGSHSSEMATGVARLVRDCNILFLEYIAPRTLKETYETFANDFTLSRYDKKPYQIAEIAKSPDALIRIPWLLRGTGILVVLVDQTGEFVEGDDLLIVNLEQLKNVYRTGDFEALYEDANRRATACANYIRSRDRLVAGQVVDYLTKLHDAYPSRELRPALVQGLLHNSAPQLERLLPGIAIKRHYYNVVENRFEQRQPNYRMTRAKLTHPHRRLSPLDIDKALILVAEEELRLLRQDTSDTNDSAITEVKSAEWRDAARSRPEAQVLASLSREDVHAQAVASLAALRNEFGAILE